MRKIPRKARRIFGTSGRAMGMSTALLPHCCRNLSANTHFGQEMEHNVLGTLKIASVHTCSIFKICDSGLSWPGKLLLLFHCTGADKQKPSVSEGWFHLGIHESTASQEHLRKHQGTLINRAGQE